MNKVKKEELERIRGGEIGTMTVIGISAIVVFLAGVIEGIVHPRKCEDNI